MGAKQARRRKFFAAHPCCCFCGGANLAATEDHIPARSMFRERKWPEGYVFPACSDCNKASATDELLMALIVRFKVSDQSEQEQRELEQAVAGVASRYPGVIEALGKALPRNETKRFFRANGVSAVEGKPIGELHLVRLPDEALDACERYGEKLVRALHYKHTAKAVPQAGVVKAYVWPMAETLTPNFLEDALRLIVDTPLIQRSTQPLGDQFSYRYTVIEDGAASAFVVRFAESMVIAGFAFNDAARYAASKAATARVSRD